MYKPVILLMILGGVTSNRNDSCEVYDRDQNQISSCEVTRTRGSCGFVTRCIRDCQSEGLAATKFQIHTSQTDDVLSMSWNDDTLMDFSVQLSRYNKNTSTHVAQLCIQVKLKSKPSINTPRGSYTYKIKTSALPERNITWRIDVMSADGNTVGNTSFTRYYNDADNRGNESYDFFIEALTTVGCTFINVSISDRHKFEYYRLSLMKYVDGKDEIIKMSTIEKKNLSTSFIIKESGTYSVYIEPEHLCRSVVTDSPCYHPVKRYNCQCRPTRVSRLIVPNDCGNLSDTFSDTLSDSSTESSREPPPDSELRPSTSNVDTKVGAVRTADTNDFTYLLIAIFCLTVVIMLISVVIFLKRCRKQISTTVGSCISVRSDSSEVSLVGSQKSDSEFSDIISQNREWILGTKIQQTPSARAANEV